MGDESLKYDDGKTRWDLLPLNAIEPIAKVLTFGANKYKPNSWQGIERERYFAAMMRHLTAYQSGELIDQESGLSHLAHAQCNLMFLQWLEIRDKDVK